MKGQESPSNRLFREILRISPEPYDYFTEREIHHLLTTKPTEYFAYIKQVLENIAHGHAKLVLRPKQVFADPEGGGDFRVMPCVIRNGDKVTKTVKIVGTNIRQSIIPDQITVGKAFALHPSENFISHIFEACLLSSARTGLCASLAAHLLAKQARHISITGAGRVGYYTAMYTSSVLPVEQLVIVDQNRERALATAARLSQDLPNIRIKTPENNNKDTSDIVFLATTSREPLYTPGMTSAKLVISLGADSDDQHELHEDWANVAKIFIDTHDTARYGDLRLWQQQNKISIDDVTDIFHLLREPGQALSESRKVFISTGSALFDNLTISYLLSEKDKN